jgi:hypothetical protein
MADSTAAIMGLDKTTTSAASFRQGFQAAQTPWFIAQNTGDYSQYSAENMKKLFKFHTLDAGEEEMKKLKISITDIKPPRSDNEWATFSIQIRSANDSDNSPSVIEQYSSVNLNENSSKFIGRVVGDQYIEWSDETNSHTVKGDYLNASSLIRVEVRNAGLNAADMPFGSFGPVRMSGWISSGSAPTDDDKRWVRGSGSIPHPIATDGDATEWLATGSVDFTGSVSYPSIPLRHSASDGGIPDQKNAYFGIDTTQAGNNNYNEGYGDLLKVLPDHSFTADPDTGTEYSYMFSLDDVRAGTAAGSAYWESGSCQAGDSYTSVSSDGILDAGYNRFTVPLYGGFDGLNITVRSPFASFSLEDKSDEYPYYSIQRAINTVSDPEVVEYNLMAAPGVMNEALTSHMINVCESRGDALAIIDLESGYETAQEKVTPSNGSAATALTKMKARGMNSSYGCAYYPWVQISDTVNDARLWVPPSIVALGTFSSSQRKSELWFAPAGFTRGGLTEGSAGVPVIQTRERLTSRNRDDLYEANINPIASFPSEGIVIFGQKTLQVTPSALDRINVRRLMIYVKKEISRMAATVLFDQNVPATWNRFMSAAEPFLRSVQARLGLADFKIVLDETTTTADLVDRNVMYAKIFLKPARSIEFIALDFVISSSGAGFED